MDVNVMNKVADNIRILEAAMVEAAKSGHPGGSMGGTDFTNVLYSKYLVYDPEDPTWFARDRFFLDPGHMSPMLYGVLAMCGRYSIDDLKNFRQWQSATPGHPEVPVVLKTVQVLSDRDMPWLLVLLSQNAVLPHVSVKL